MKIKVGDRVRFAPRSTARLPHGHALAGDVGTVVHWDRPRSGYYDWGVSLDKCPENTHYFIESDLELILVSPVVVSV